MLTLTLVKDINALPIQHDEPFGLHQSLRALSELTAGPLVTQSRHLGDNRRSAATGDARCQAKC